MTKLRVLLGVFILFSFEMAAQISPRLQAKMEEASQEYYSIRIEFLSEVDFVALKAHFESEDIIVSQRPKWVNRLLLKQAQKSQKEVLEFLKNRTLDELVAYRSFYIVNMMIVVGTSDLIRKLSMFSEVQWLDLADDEVLIHEPIISSKKSAEAVNGIEPGLAAINAPAMWRLGFTGRGRLVYNYDTGVWATHPSFSNRFLGNYKPLSQSWYGLEKDYPDGRISNHGTHTLGIMAGLDTATHDTIGVAFGAYWMANDYVNSTVATLPPLAEMIQAFEWALNPDGDTNTSDDVPDVINNSWRWRDNPDTVQCGGYVVQLMDAIEAAGIANVFSGGNAGPNNSTVSAPQRINTNKTSTFSVGSVNANLTFPYPISSFSSRGPTQCPGTGSLKIHPEVVAPGQDVRSAWGMDGYNTISGTSMAAPHVSGAVLLLKEAFPQLSGADLLNALYQTAIDMGATGEDNTYGNGMIDVYAAYQYLALSQTPVNPKQVDWDVAVKVVNYTAMNDDVTCSDLLSINVTLENLGSNTIDSVECSLWLDEVPVGNGAYKFVLPAGGMLPGAIKSISFPVVLNVLTMGNHKLKVKVSLTEPEYDYVNNQRIIRFNKREKMNLPFKEDFEQASDFTKWYVKNDDFSKTWDSTDVVGWPGNTKAAIMGFHQYSPRANQKDEFWSPVFEIPSGANSGMGFDLAYQQLGVLNVVQDTLRIKVSTDCGKTFGNVVYEKSASDLNTTNMTGVNFVPTSQADWRRDYVDLSAFAGMEILLSFEGTNRGGNNLYLDNISVYEGLWDPISIEEQTKNHFSIYPNPSADFIHLTADKFSAEPITIQIIDISGKVVLRKTLLESNSTLDITSINNGLYLVRVAQGNELSILRLVKR